MLFYEIHTHNEFSLFDGFGKSEQSAPYVASLGHKAYGLTNHGNISGLIKHFKACVENDLVPIMGCEFYFQPQINKEERTYHLCLFAKSMEGWKNLNLLTTESNKEENYHYHGNVDFDMLEKYSEGIVCSSACVAGYLSSLALNDKKDEAVQAAKRFKQIFGNNFFIEIMPFDVFDDESGKNIQKIANKRLIQIAHKLDIPIIVTTDSHYIKKEDFDSYLKMHKMKESTIGDHYQDRYLHTAEEVEEALTNWHPDIVDEVDLGMKKFYKKFKDTAEWFKFEDIDMPSYTDSPDKTYDLMRKQALSRLKKEGKTSDKYKKEFLKELDVIKYHGFQDYFMIVQEYVNWAKKNDIAVGPGRGSAGNSIINYGLGITDVDSVYFNNNFDRFLRKDKKKFPDIDVDFCQTRRNEVIQHIIDQYPKRAAQTLTYGTYNIKNLVVDLSKVCNNMDENKEDVEDFKRFLAQYCDDNEHTIDPKLYKDYRYKAFNEKYDNVAKHFTKMYGKVRFFGTHASSVILCHNVEKKAGLMRVGGNLRTSFDLHDIEFLKLLKLDILGLSTATKVRELRAKTGTKFSYDIFEDKEMLNGFKQEGTFDVFQFESNGACDIARRINISSFEDIVAATSLNRPGPLSLGLDKVYEEAKKNPDKTTPWYQFTQNTYGVLIYQEQGMDICKKLGNLNPEITDKLVKADINHITTEQRTEWEREFYKGCKENGISDQDAEKMFSSLLCYSFNRGHGIAYAMLSAELMYYKVHYPLQFWLSTFKYESNETKMFSHKANAVRDGIVFMLPHVNGKAGYSIVNVDGEDTIQEGLSSLKNVGLKAAQFIESEKDENGPYKDKDDFLDRIEPYKRVVNARVIATLEEQGALLFDNKKYIERVVKYNSSLYSRR